MGRGLSAILSVTTPDEAARELRELPVGLISPNPRQPRRSFDRDTLQALAGSLAERGMLQPVMVRPRPGGRYELIAGERRWRAAQLARFETVPALVEDQGDAQALEAALIENMAREDLNPIEEARACAALVEELGLRREDVGRKVGRSRVAVSNLMRLLDLPDGVIETIEAGRLSAGHGRALLLADGHDARLALARAAVEHSWSVRTLEERSRASNASQPGPRITRAGRRGAHPDQAQAAREIADALSSALGAEVTVKAARDGSYRAVLSFGGPDEALELARRIRPRAVA